MAAFTTTQTGPTQMDFIASIVQKELLENTVILGSVTNWSSLVSKGDQTVAIPRFNSNLVVGEGRFGDPDAQNPDGTTEVALKVAELEVDTIVLDQWRNLSYRIPDRITQQSRVNLESELARKAGREFAIYMDGEILSVLQTLTNTLSYSGGADAQTGATTTMALADISEAKRLLDKENVENMNRILLIGPDAMKAILNIDQFRNANQYGAREALLNGEVGTIYGMRTLESNLVGRDEAFAYNSECVGYATQESVNFETQRAHVMVRATDYSFATGWGFVLMYDGKKGVRFIGT